MVGGLECEIGEYCLKLSVRLHASQHFVGLEARRWVTYRLVVWFVTVAADRAMSRLYHQ